MPTSLAGVSVIVNSRLTGIFFVSPGQINFLVPYDLTTSTVTVLVTRQGSAGPVVTIPLATTAPAFFEWNGNFAVAEHADGSLIAPAWPANPGEIIVLFGTGLGRTSPDLPAGQTARSALPILYASQLQITVDGVTLPPEAILYAGVTPGYAGLYQINLRLPDTLAPNPEIRVAIAGQVSPPSIRLFANGTQP